MDLRWTDEAATDLEQIAGYLFETAPLRAPDLVDAIYKLPESLLKFPYRGRPGKKHGTRELVASPLPYLIVYRVESDTLLILRILHGAQKWP